MTKSAGSPSAWSARLPILILAGVGFCLASYLAAYQFGAIGRMWEPIFGRGSRTVLHSFVSRLLPVPDAAVGAAGYLAEIITGVIGGRERYYTSPATVLVYGAIVISLAVAAIILVFLQAFVLRAGCTLCLISAALSLAIAWLARDEVLASIGILRQQRADAASTF